MDEPRYTPKEIQHQIEELRLTLGVTIERIEDKPAFDIVIVWGGRRGNDWSNSNLPENKLRTVFNESKRYPPGQRSFLGLSR